MASRLSAEKRAGSAAPSAAVAVDWLQRVGKGLKLMRKHL